MRIDRAILRSPSKKLFVPGGLTVGIPNEQRARLQHAELCKALQDASVAVTLLNADPAFAQCAMVGDDAIVAERLAILSNFTENDPREGEQGAAASVLAGSHFLKFISAPGHLHAGDVARIGDHFYIGKTGRTNAEGAAQAAFFLKDFGYNATVIDMSDFNIGELRAAICDLGQNRVLIHEDLARHYALITYEKITAARAPGAVAVNGKVLLPHGNAEAKSAAERAGLDVIAINLSEFDKIGVTLAGLVLPLPRCDAESLSSHAVLSRVA